MQCPACLSRKTSESISHPKDREYFFNRSSDSSYLKCLNCGSLFQNPWPSPEETQSFYHENYQNYTSCQAPGVSQLFKIFTSRSAQKFLQDLDPNAHILDYGCNQGFFLSLLRKMGYQNLHGYDVVEPDPKLKEDFQFISTLEDLKKSSQSYDVIRMNHVIEHLSDLDEIMHTLTQKLRVGGYITGETPNAAHYTLKLFKDYWGPLHYPYHTLLFTPKGLHIAAERWGLSLTKVNPCLIPTGWAMSLENFMKETMKSKQRGRSSAYGIYLILTAWGALFDRLSSPFTGTAIMDFKLVKN